MEIFGKIAGVTGLVMTKLDGTARGGILVAIAAKFGLPVHFIGVGESVEDLSPFTARDFARAVVGMENRLNRHSGRVPAAKPESITNRCRLWTVRASRWSGNDKAREPR